MLTRENTLHQYDGFEMIDTYGLGQLFGSLCVDSFGLKTRWWVSLDSPVLVLVQRSLYWKNSLFDSYFLSVMSPLCNLLFSIILVKPKKNCVQTLYINYWGRSVPIHPFLSATIFLLVLFAESAALISSPSPFVSLISLGGTEISWCGQLMRCYKTVGIVLLSKVLIYATVEGDQCVWLMFGATVFSNRQYERSDVIVELRWTNYTNFPDFQWIENLCTFHSRLILKESTVMSIW